MKGEHRPGYRRPRTGERRRVRQPLAIDALPPEARQEIQKFRAAGKTWQEIEELSPSFAGRRLPMASLHRWYDLRVEQVQREVMAQAERARVIAAEFGGKNFEKLPEAVRNAISSQVFALIEAQGKGEQKEFLKELTSLGWLLARQRQLDQEDARLAIERKKLESLTEKIKGVKKESERKKLTGAELQKRLDEIYDIAQQAA